MRLLSTIVCACLTSSCLFVAPQSGSDAGSADGSVREATVPLVLSTLPADLATEVEVGLQLIRVGFSEPMDIESLELVADPAIDLGTRLWSESSDVVVPLGSALQADTTYRLTVRAKSAQGGLLAPTQFSFKTAAGGQPATLLVSQPADGAMGVPTNAPLSFTFSAAMAPATFELTSEPAHDFGAPSWSTDGHTVSYAASQLDASVTYRISLSGQSTQGVALTGTLLVTFTTGANRDTVSPILLASSPASNAMGVSAQTNISMEFSEPMSATETEAAITVSPQIDCTFAWDTTHTRCTCTPATALGFNTQYTVTLSTGARDVAGNTLTAAASFSFMTAVATSSDVTAPTVLAFNPGNGVGQVSPTTALSMTFSEPMDKLSVESNFVIAAPCAFSWNSNFTTVTCRPTGSLMHGVTYNWSLMGAKDLAGNALAPAHASTFTTTALPTDTTAPTVVSLDPRNQTGVAVTTLLRVNFSEPMNKTVTQAAFVAPSGVTCVFTWNATSTQLVCDPQSNLAYSRSYTFSIGVGAKDVAGNALAAISSASFSTQAAPDTTSPTITQTIPSSNQSGIARDTRITVTFSEPMETTSVQSALVVTPTSARGGQFTWNAERTRFSYAPPTLLPYGTQVTWRLTTAAKDRANNSLADFSRSFTVIRLGSITVTSRDDLDGHVSSAGLADTTGNIFVGDSSADEIHRGFISFSLAVMPTTTTRIISASLTVDQVAVYGTPFTNSSLTLVSIFYGTTLTPSDYPLPDVAGGVAFSKSTALGLKQANVTAFVQNDWSKRSARSSLSQFGLIFPGLLIRNGAPDRVSIGTTSSTGTPPQLRIEFEYP